MAKNKPQWIIVHHTATARDTTTFYAVNRNHKKRWNFRSSLGHYIGYHYFIDTDGKITQGRADQDVGAHTKQKSMNWKSIGICLAGNFDNEAPSPMQIASLRSLLLELTDTYKIPPDRIVPHRYFKPTSCYGRKIESGWAQMLATPPEVVDTPPIRSNAESVAMDLKMARSFIDKALKTLKI